MKIKVTEGKMDCIICNRWTFNDALNRASISSVKFFQGNCSKCNHKVSYSEASKILLEQRPGLELICLECITLQLQNNPQSVELATTPKHLIEIERIRLERMRSKN